MRKTSSRCSIRLHPVQKCARKLRVIYCIDSEDKEFNARKKLETPLAPPMHSKTCKKGQNGETRSKTNDFKSKLACILEARVNPQDCVWKNLYLIMMRTTLQEKGTIHYSITNMVHKLCPQAMKIPAAKAAMDEWEKPEKILAWNKTKVRSKSEVIDEARTKGAKSSFCLTDGHMSFKECWIGDKVPKIQRSTCTARQYCERRFGVLCSIHWTSITNDCSKSHGYHIQTARVRRTSSWRSIRLHPSKNGGRSKVAKNSKVRMSRYMDSSSTTQVDKIMVKHRRPSGSSWAKIVRTPTCWPPGRSSKKFCWYSCPRKTRIVQLYAHVDDFKMAGRQPAVISKGCPPRSHAKLVKTGKYAGNKAAAHPGQDNRLLGVVTHPKSLRAPRSIKGWDQGTWIPACHRLGHWPVILLCGDGSMYSQAHVRGWRSAFHRPSSSVVAHDRGYWKRCLREAGGPVRRAETAVKMLHGCKGGPWVRLKRWTCVLVRSPKTTSGTQRECKPNETMVDESRKML